MAQPEPSRLFGVLVTFRRPGALATHLDVLSKQTRRIDHLVVVDNGPDGGSRRIVADHPEAASTIEHLEMHDNLGPAGALARGLDRVLQLARDDDWVILLDDDDEPQRDDLVEKLLAFAAARLEDHPALGMVGLVGARIDLGRGRIVRLRDDQLEGAVPVDYVGGSQLPLVRVQAVRRVGAFADDLFFGFDDLEFGLRLREAGYDVLVDGDLAYWGRVNAGRLGDAVGAPHVAETALRPWRHYYSVRNLVWILRQRRRRRAALEVSLTAVLKGTVLLVRRSGDGWPYLKLSVRAVADAWRARLGRTVLPPG